MNALVPVQQTNTEVYRASTDAADLCREIVVRTAMEIQDRKYVRVEGWQAIAIAHGCTASARDVERVDGGVRAIGEIRRMSDGAMIAQAEGFVGEDEPIWFGGTARAWKWGKERGQKVWYDKEHVKRPDYAIRAMAQTRAISRACRSAFAHVVVMIDSGLSTTPAEEVPMGGFDDEQRADPVRDEPPALKPQGQQASTPFERPAAQLTEVVAPPDSKDPADWESWRKIIVGHVQRATTPEQVTAIQRANGAGLASCAAILEDTVSRMAALVEAKAAKLAQAEAA